jgi:hypothetical protein
MVASKLFTAGLFLVMAVFITSWGISRNFRHIVKPPPKFVPSRADIRLAQSTWQEKQLANVPLQCRAEIAANFVFPLVTMVYVLNMDRSADRMAHMSKLLTKMGMPFERVAGVNPAVDHPMRGVWQGTGRGKLPLGILGCWLGHLNVWKRLLESVHEYALVMEVDLGLLLAAANGLFCAPG